MNHIDLDRSNNKPENLEWSSKSEQAQHSHANNTNRRSGAPQTSKPLKAKPVGGTDEQVRSFGSLTKAADDLKVNQGHISACCLKKLKTATAKDKTKWTFWYDTEAAPPACLDGDGMHEVVAPETLTKGLSWFWQTVQLPRSCGTRLHRARPGRMHGGSHRQQPQQQPSQQPAVPIAIGADQKVVRDQSRPQEQRTKKSQKK